MIFDQRRAKRTVLMIRASEAERLRLRALADRLGATASDVIRLGVNALALQVLSEQRTDQGGSPAQKPS